MYRLTERPARHLYASLAQGPGAQAGARAWAAGDGPGRHRHGSVEELPVDRATSLVQLRGECDIAVAPRLTRCISGALAAGRTRLVIDLCEAEFVEVTVLSALLYTHRRLAEQGGRMAIACVPGEVREAFAASGLDDVFALFATRQEALAYLSAQAAA